MIRSDLGWNPALEGPFLLIESETGRVVHLENRKSGLFLHEDADVEMYEHAAELVHRSALSREESARFIAQIAERMENGT